MTAERPESASWTRWRAFGPGLIFAGAAVGVSHLVQSTRGGAQFGLLALLIVVASCLVKWPAFRAGPVYAAATGDSLLEGYRRRGRWAIGAFGLLTLLIWFTTLAAVTVVSAGLLLALAPGLDAALAGIGSGGARTATVSAGLLLLTFIGLATGGYRLLERAMKVVMPTLFVVTMAAMVSMLPRAWSSLDVAAAADAFAGEGTLVAAIVGWMPAPIDIAVWTSLWTLAKRRPDGGRRDRGTILLDFDAGYLATFLLAIGFTILGAGVMHGRGLVFADSSVGFATQVVDLFAESLGAWSWPVVALAAFLTMFSTTVTCVDGFSRTVARYAVVLRGRRDGPSADDGDRRDVGYWVAFGVGVAGALVVLFGGLAMGVLSFTSLIDVVTVTSFLAAPVLAVMNHACVFGPDLTPEQQQGRFWWAWSWICIVGTTGFAIFYVVARIVA